MLVNETSGLTLKVKQWLYADASPFQKIEVVETYAYGRVLLLGGMAVFTERDEFIYNEMLTHPAMLFASAPRQVCIIGGGDGGVLREALKHDSVGGATVVEIDSMVTDTVRRFFPDLGAALDDPRAEIVFQDGRTFLENPPNHYDCIIVDSYDPRGPVQSLESDNFYELARDALNPGGVLVVQTDAPELYREKIEATLREMRAMFSWISPYIAAIPTFPTGICGFVAGGLASRRPTADLRRAQAIAAHCRYYNDQMQSAAFCLPGYVQRIFGTV